VSESKRRTSVKRFFLSLLFAAGISMALAFLAGLLLKQIDGNVQIRQEEFYLFAVISALVIFLLTLHPANRPLRFFKNIGRILLLVLLTGLVWAWAFLWVGQDALLYPPVNTDIRAEEALKNTAQAEAITVTGPDGQGYQGWFLKNGPEKAGLVLYFGGNSEESAARAQAMLEPGSQQLLAGYHFMMLDYPGTGQSLGTRSEESILKMARAAWDYAAGRAEVNPDQIVLMGWSLGTGTAVRLAGEKHPAGLILFAPYYSGGELTTSFVELLLNARVPVPLPIRNPYRSDHHAKSVQSPALVVAARDDALVPYGQSQRLAALFPSAQLVSLETGGHGAMWRDQASILAVQAFLTGL